MGDGGSKVACNFSTDDGEGVFDSKGEQWRLVIKAYISAVGIINLSKLLLTQTTCFTSRKQTNSNFYNGTLVLGGNQYQG